MEEKQIIVLSLVGLVMFNLFSTYTSTFYYETDGYAIKQLIFIFTGLFLGLLLYAGITFPNATSDSMRRFYLVNGFFAGLTVFFSFLLFILPEAYLPTINGAKRWIKFMGVTIAPIEVTKISFVFIFTHIFSSKRFEENKDTKGLGLFFPVYVLFALYLVVITYKQKDLGNFFLFSAVFITMTLLFFNKLRVVFKMVGLGVGLLAAVVLLSPHRRDRIMQWFESTSDVGSASANYQVEQGFFAINEGGLWGVGPGESVMKLGYIPEPHTDMIITVLMNEVGLFGILVYCALFFSLFYALVKSAIKTGNLYVFNFSFLTSLLMIYQLFINMFGILGIIPLKGINVPFLSYGGSSAISILLLLFLNFSLLAVLNRQAFHQKREKEERVVQRRVFAQRFRASGVSRRDTRSLSKPV